MKLEVASHEEQSVRMLVVDDSDILRLSLTFLVDAHQELEVVGTAENGREAVDKVEELAPDMVLMDLQMPEMNGLDATATIRDRHPAVHVIVVTTHDSPQIRDACKRAGAEGFVTKRAGGQQILNEIQRVLWDSACGSGS